MKASGLLATVVFVILAPAGRAQAMHADEYLPPLHLNGRAVVLPTAIFRNGDWFAVGGVGIVTVSPRTCGRYFAATSRAELGIGGADAAIGLATNIADASCELDQALMGSGLVSIEAHVARMYGPTFWRRTEYAGAQVSLAAPAGMMRVTLGLMVDVHDHADAHGQFGFGVSF
jgi:hypothetical protein